MPVYNILGVPVFVPDLNDLTTAIVNPITATFSSVIGQISQAIISGLSFLNGIGAQIASAISNSLLPALSSLVNPIASFFAAIPAQFGNALNAIGNSVSSAFQFLASSFSSAFAAVGNALQSAIVQPLIGFFINLENRLGAVFAPLANILNQVPLTISNALAAIGNSFINGVQQAFAHVQTTFSIVGTALTSFGANLQAGLTNFGNALNIFGTRLQATFADFGAQTYNGLQKFVVQPFLTAGSAILQGVLNLASNFNQAVKNTIINILPRTPEQAFSSALTIAEVGIGQLIVGEITGLLAEAGYPTKHLGIIESFHKVIESTGALEAGSALYGIIISSGWKIQLEYYFMSLLQPRKPNPALVQKGIYYDVGTLEQFTTALRYEGLNDEAISLAVGTLYQPLPPRLITKFIDNGVLNIDFFARQLRRSGLDPADIPDILTSFQLLKVAQYQSTARQIVATAAKHGYLNAELQRASLKLVGIGDEQIKIVQYFAQLEAQDALLLDIEDTILTLMTKGGITPEEATIELVLLGLDKTRAEARVKLKAIKAAPNPSKADRQALAEAVLSIPLTS